MNSMKLSAIFLILCGALLVSGRSLSEVEATAASDAEKPKIESPSYKVVNVTDEFEVREYENATWAVAFGRSRWLTDFAVAQAGFGLANYFKGFNEDHIELGLTIPIVGTILGHPPPPPPRPPHKNDSHPEARPPLPPHHHNGSHPPHPPPPPGPPAVALAGFIPSKFKGDPPKPNCRHVKILHTNTTTVYSRTFGGFAFSWTVKHEIDHLAHALKEAGVCPFKGKFFVATYDGPWKWFGRTNEVWWTKFPKHHNKTDAGSAASGLEILDPHTLFPEEFPPPPEKPEGVPEGPATQGWESDAAQKMVEPELAEEFEGMAAQAQATSEDVVDAIVNVA